MKEYKETAYNDVIKTFHFEEGPRGQIKKFILKKLGKCWKDTRSNMFHTFYDNTKSLEDNVKNHKPGGMDPEYWKNAETSAKQLYTYTGGSMTLARRRGDEEAIQEIEGRDQSYKELSQNDSEKNT
ncbi:hypothetical protein PIB30_090361 [Stylosanthes scabra]|uniref:Uncharacterized protein n=1 Tax=Stylosanthes scabra TaxID=79078 RepID=A0ABU6VSR1_9FABA|nr:hypothetical protein [Stylosanthes scabra]